MTMALVDFAQTDTQKRYAEAFDRIGSENAVAREFGVDRDKVRSSLRSVKKRRDAAAQAARQGYSPEHDMTHPAAEGFTLKRHSRNYIDGELKQEWVISEPDKEYREALIASYIEGLSQDLPRLPKTPKPKHKLSSDLCNLYTLTDCHVGMLAWHKEGGADWDLKIAERTLVDCFGMMMAGAPECETAVINELGDFEHFDGYDAVTPTHRHQLDADGRFPKIVEASIRIRRTLIEMALKKHKRVVCVIAEGNHNIVSSVWMRKMFAAIYENEPRVEVVDTELPYYTFEFGAVMLGFHHGHVKKKEALPLLFASQYSEMWGRTTSRHIHVGHQHHLDIKEHSGATVYQHPTLAARDAHASRGGYHAERQAICMTFHRKHGYVASNHVSPDMLC